MSKTPEELIPALRQYLHNDGSYFVTGYDIEVVNRRFAALKKKSERLLRELSDAHSKIVDLEAGEEKLKARVAEMENQFVPVARLEQGNEDESIFSDDPSDFIVEWGTRRKIKSGEILYIKEPANEG